MVARGDILSASVQDGQEGVNFRIAVRIARRAHEIRSCMNSNSVESLSAINESNETPSGRSLVRDLDSS
jgi:hypothetical protein